MQVPKEKLHRSRFVEHLAKLANRCCSEELFDRPTAEELVQILDFTRKQTVPENVLKQPSALKDMMAEFASHSFDNEVNIFETHGNVSPGKGGGG